MTGTSYIVLTDPDRKEVLGKKNGQRKVTIRFYYPGKESRDVKPGDCLSAANRKWLNKKADFSLYEKRIRLYEGIGMKDGTFPLILFSHGYGGFVEQNNDLCQYLADHGYIVASIGHSYEANETVYDDGTSVRFDNSLYFKMFRPLIPTIIDLTRLRGRTLSDEEALERFDRHQNRYERFIIGRVDEWAKDDHLALGRIRELNEDRNSFLYHRIDFSNGVGATGHSYGGALAYRHCLYDDEISCGINIDGGLFGNFGSEVNHKPFLQILNRGNVNVVSRSRLYHDAPVHYMIFRDMEHNGFTDLKLTSKNAKLVGNANPELTMNTLNEVHVTFFDRYLKTGDRNDRTPLPINQTAIEKYEVL